MVDLISTNPMTGVDLKSTLARMGITQGQLALAWGYSEEHVSRWVNGKKAVPAWVPYALGLKTIGAATAEKPVETPKPFAERVAILDPAIGPVVLSASPDDPSVIMATPLKKPKSDDRPFRYMGGRKVYL